MYRVNTQTGQGFKAHDRQFQSMRSAWASGLHLRSRTDEKRGAGDEVNTFDKAHSSTTDTNARGMLLPAFAGRKPRVLWRHFSFRPASLRSPRSATKHSFSPC